MDVRDSGRDVIHTTTIHTAKDNTEIIELFLLVRENDSMISAWRVGRSFRLVIIAKKSESAEMQQQRHQPTIYRMNEDVSFNVRVFSIVSS
jgi:hypothetical protein